MWRRLHPEPASEPERAVTKFSALGRGGLVVGREREERENWRWWRRDRLCGGGEDRGTCRRRGEAEAMEPRKAADEVT